MFVLALFASCGNPEETKGTETTTEAETTTDAKIADEVPKDLNYSKDPNNTITFFGRNNSDLYKTEICCEDFGTGVLNDAIHYRNIDIENRLGIKIRQFLADATEGNNKWQTWNETLATSVLLNTGDYDVVTFNAYCGSVLAQRNVYKNLYTCNVDSGNGYIDLTKPWWNEKTVDELSYCGALFFVGSSLCTTEIQNAFATFFNKDLFNTLYPDEDYSDLYEYADNYQWTIDMLTDYVEHAYRDVDGDGTTNVGDTLGWLFDTRYATMSTWVFAMGLKFTNRNQFGEIELSYIHDSNLVDIWEKVMKLYGSNGENRGTLKYSTDGAVTKTGMDQGNLLFVVQYVSKGEDLRNSEVEYGFLPVPMYNEEQGEYLTNCATNASMFAIPSNLDADRTKMVTAMSEIMAAMSYNDVLPEYYSVVAEGIYSKDLPDAQQYDRVRNSLILDFGIVMFPKNGGLQDYSNLFKNFSDGFDIAQTIGNRQTAWEGSLEDLLLALEEAADKSFEK